MQENRTLKHKLSEAQKLNHQQQLEAESMLALKEEFSYEERCKVMAEDLEAMRSENKLLKDHNDEMANEIEALKMQLMLKLNLSVNDKFSGQNSKSNVNADDECDSQEFESNNHIAVVIETNCNLGVDLNDVENGSPYHHSQSATPQYTLQHRRNGSWLSDYIKAPAIKQKGCGSPITPNGGKGWELR